MFKLCQTFMWSSRKHQVFVAKWFYYFIYTKKANSHYYKLCPTDKFHCFLPRTTDTTNRYQTNIHILCVKRLFNLLIHYLLLLHHVNIVDHNQSRPSQAELVYLSFKYKIHISRCVWVAYSKHLVTTIKQWRFFFISDVIWETIPLRN